MKRKVFSSIFLLVLFAGNTFAQEQEKYLIGTEKKLEMIVHIIGEVRRPGEYRVEDKTNLMELISKAGGPTEFSSLSRVKITRVGLISSASNGDKGNADRLKTSTPKFGKQIIEVNVNDYLNDENYRRHVPTLQPGDVIFISRNNWFRWRNVVSVARDLSVIASVYFIYLRATKN